MPRFVALVVLAACSVACQSAPPPDPAEPEPPPPVVPVTPIEESPPPSAEPDETAPESPAAPAETAPTPGGMQWASQSSDPRVKDAWRKCAADADCALVEIACCDHCNGGKAVAVNKQHVQDAAKLRPSCGPTACTKRGCLTRAACESGACVMQSPSGAP